MPQSFLTSFFHKCPNPSFLPSFFINVAYSSFLFLINSQSFLPKTLFFFIFSYYKMTKTTPTQTNKKRSGKTNNDKASKKREIEDPASSEGMYIFKCIIFIINNVINFLFVNIK